MICKRCERIGVLDAFCFSPCEICSEEIVTSHMPCYKLCDKCSSLSFSCGFFNPKSFARAQFGTQDDKLQEEFMLNYFENCINNL